MKTFATIFFFLNLALFVIFNIITISRFMFYPKIWSLMVHHPVQSLFLGTYPMGAATLISVAVTLFYQDDGVGGAGFLYTLWGFWWLDLVLSALCAYHLVHIMYGCFRLVPAISLSYHKHHTGSRGSLTNCSECRQHGYSQS